MEREKVSSSNLASVGYDESDNTLEVEFLNGTIYQYYEVPKSVFDGLMNAASHGTFLNLYVKKAGFAYEKVG